MAGGPGQASGRSSGGRRPGRGAAVPGRDARRLARLWRPYGGRAGGPEDRRPFPLGKIGRLAWRPARLVVGPLMAEAASAKRRSAPKRDRGSARPFDLLTL
jgi:hypothetical protein